MAKECRRVWGETSVFPERTAASRSTPHAPCRVSRPPRALRNTAGRRPPDGGGREGRTPAHQVGVERADRVAADRDVALLAALAAEPDRRVGRQVVEVVDVEAGHLGDPRPGPVEELEQRAVAQHPRVGVVGRPGRVEQPLDLVDGDRLGQPPRRRGRRDLAGRVVDGQALGAGERVQPADRHHRAADRAGGERRVIFVAGVQRGPELGHVERGDVAELGLAPRRQDLGVPVAGRAGTTRPCWPPARAPRRGTAGTRAPRRQRSPLRHRRLLIRAGPTSTQRSMITKIFFIVEDFRSRIA